MDRQFLAACVTTQSTSKNLQASGPAPKAFCNETKPNLWPHAAFNLRGGVSWFQTGYKPL